jgi:hypothetical protein
MISSKTPSNEGQAHGYWVLGFEDVWGSVYVNTQHCEVKFRGQAQHIFRKKQVNYHDTIRSVTDE